MGKIDPAFEELIKEGLRRFEEIRLGIDRRAKQADEVVKEMREQMVGLAHFGTTFPQGLLNQTDIMAVGRMNYDHQSGRADEVRLSTGYNQQQLVTVIGRGIQLDGEYDAIVILRKAVRS